MTSTVSKEQLNRIIYSYHWDPFEVLGFHQVKVKNQLKSVVRAFFPVAEKVELVIKNKTFNMVKIHKDGFFEIVLDITDKPDYNFKITNSENHNWHLNDPYKYGTVLTDFDLHLLSEGNHFKSYEKLGSHLIEHEGTKGVHFAVWAPNAKRVSVIGDFNHWDGRYNQMRNRGSSGIWELFIPDLVEGENYKYEIKTQNDALVQKTDPYAFMCELRPKTASKVYKLSKYKWNDEIYLDKRKKSNMLTNPMSIYELHLGSWKRDEENNFLNYRDLADQLVDYVLDMGYTHIELLPVLEHPFDGSWGYQVTGYFAPTSRHGNCEDFSYFVDKMHQNGIGIILDWVPAHFPNDQHGLAKFDGTSLYEHDDPRLGYHKEWDTLIFNYGRNEVKNFLISSALFWFDYYHIDGLRVDAVASMLYLDYSRNPGEWIPNKYGGNENLDAIDFIKKLNEQVYLEHPDVLMIAEESTAWIGVSRPTYLGGLGFGLKWNMGWMNDFLTYISKDPIYRKYHHNNLTFSMIYAYTENFILVLSHDEVVHGKSSIISKMPGDDWQKFANTRLAIGFMYAHPGKKLLFMGTEFGQWSEWNHNQSIDWNLLDWERHRKLKNFFKELNKIYKQNPGLYEIDFDSNGFQWVNCNDWEGSVVSFLRKGFNREEVILIVANFTPIVRHNYKVGVPFYCHWQEILNSDAVEFGGGGVGNSGGFWSDSINWDYQPFSLNITLPPLSILYFKPKLL
ncbi:MAG: 1,4-alpha-glucan branching protein GlgB [Spirochaetes bacterium]|nr:1,4-alpha-glucan branching protein GlgB [Spirochaetota bacterium]